MTGASPKDALGRAVLAHRAGRLGEAEGAYGVILQSDPENADALHLLGLVRHQQGKNEAALEAVERALRINAQAANFHNSHGLVLHALGRFSVAEVALKKALSLAPDDADAHNNLGLVYSAQRRFSRAVASLQRSLEIRPRYPAALNNIGRALVAVGRPAEAVAHLTLACELDPKNAVFANTLGVALREFGRYDDAQIAYEHALNLDPDNVDAHVSHAQLLLTNGDFTAGWPEHEWRLRRVEHGRRPAESRWNGVGSLEGKTLLLWAEQGLGDAIQFVRYASDATDAGARVVVECAPTLHRLFASAPGVSRVVAPGEPVSFDLHCPLMSLTSCFGGTPSGRAGAYLSSSTPLDLGGRGARGGGVKVGLVWAGNPRHANDANRSAGLAEFAPLAAASGSLATFYGLQKGPAAEQSAPPKMAYENLGPGLLDFQDTASALAALDLLITVDTSVAHLAGAMGIPVWVLLPYVADWRWLRDRDDSPWYGSMRLFRQDKAGDWSDVINRMSDILLNELLKLE